MRSVVHQAQISNESVVILEVSYAQYLHSRYLHRIHRWELDTARLEEERAKLEAMQAHLEKVSMARDTADACTRSVARIGYSLEILH